MRNWLLLFTCCSGLLSAEFILNPPNGRVSPLTMLDPVVFSCSEGEALARFFRENGYVVVDGVSAVEHRNDLVDLVDRIMKREIPLSRRLGFMDLYHDNTLAQLRQNPNLYEVFTHLFGSEKLWVVFDRVIHQLPEEEEDVLNPHVDQNPLKDPHFSYAQAMLALRDMDESTGTLALVPKSHLFFEEYAAWAKPNDGYIENQGNRELPFVALRLKEGQIVIWDSRTTHSRFRGEAKNKRYAALLTFTLAKDDSALTELRLRYFDEGIGWNNHEAGLRATSRPRCEQSLRETEEILTPLGLKLYGLTSWFSGFKRTWGVGGDIEVSLQSEASFDISEREMIQLFAHLPGFQNKSPESPHSSLEIALTYSDKDALELTQSKGKVEVHSNWSSRLPADFIHLLYGACRLEWLQQGICPAHAACIGNERDGYVLLIGAPGSGKTSLTMHNTIHHGFKIFSGDKTLLSFNDKGELEAIAGTHTITVRGEDVSRWASVPKAYEFPLGDRQAFQLAPNFYEPSARVPIKQIFLVGLNDNPLFHSEIAPLSALHELYPFFLDKQREDILVGADQGFFNGAVDQELRAAFAKKLYTALQNIPVYRVKGSLEETTAFIHSKYRAPPKKILFGVCGIGNGHCNRQMPIVSHLLDQGHQVMVFTYGEGLAFFKDRFPFRSNLTVVPVANPYYVGCLEGLDFEQTAMSEKNQGDFYRINALAMFRAVQELGRPDLVISDYEMVAAQYAYAKGAPLVTLDQQSKYLVGDFVINLYGTSYLDEVERLNLFFPMAAKRIAVSFFQVKSDSSEVEIMAPMVRPEIVSEKGAPRSAVPSLLVYITSQQLGNQPIDAWIDTIRTAVPEGWEAHIFLPKRLELPLGEDQLHFYHHGDPLFDSILLSCHGVISTAGHTLLSEAMYLEKPVYALPLPLYEQQLNAYVIAAGGFDIREEDLSGAGLTTFIENLEVYAENIRQDQKWLIKEPGNALIIQKIDELLKS